MSRYSRIAHLGAFVAVLVATRAWGHLVFHSLAEMFCIVVASAMFVLVWNTRRVLQNDYVMLVGIASLFVAAVDLLHMLSYEGVGVLPSRGADLPTQLWIAGRYLEAATFLAAPLLLGRRTLRPEKILLGYAGATALLLALVLWWDVFPTCYVAGRGLTPFKRASEYAISVAFLAGLLLIIRHRRRRPSDLHGGVFGLITAALATRIATELIFTLYTGVYDGFNVAGHVLKFVAFFLLYRAIVETGLREPFSIVLRALKQSEEELRRQRDELREALGHVKTLRGLLPICAACKKIRDDQGYWKQIEVYVREHSEAEFSHSVCPECARRLYPDLVDEEEDPAK